jgi:hypothetical protein
MPFFKACKEMNNATENAKGHRDKKGFFNAKDARDAKI